MPPYYSPLEALLKARKYREEVVCREMMEQTDLFLIEKTQLEEWIEAAKSATEQLSLCQKNGGLPAELQSHYMFIQYQEKKIKQQQEKVALQNKALEKKREELKEVVQERQIVEKLEARKKEAFLEEIKKKENLLLDEVASRLKRRIG